MTDPFDEWHRPLSKSIAKPAFIGTTLLIALVGGFGNWAATAPLASASVAPGQFVATGQNKIIQHLEGGIVRTILVKEGDKVKAGDLLIELDDTTPTSEARRLELKRDDLLATIARLEAIELGTGHIGMPAEITAKAADPTIAKLIAVQTALFKAAFEEFDAQKAISARQIGAIEEEIAGLKSERTAVDVQLASLQTELGNAETLFAKGLSQSSRIEQLRRSIAKANGDIGQSISEVARAEQRILENRSTLVHVKAKQIEDAGEQHKTATAELADTEARLISVRDMVRRAKILAPVDGVIVRLQTHTVGGTVPPNQPIAEILPSSAKLLVEAMVKVEDIDNVHVGQDAELRLSTLNRRTTPSVHAKVIYVSADKLPGKDDKSFYYLARIEADPAELLKAAGEKVVPGLPAEVYVMSGERTLLQYILKPIRDSMARGMREN